MTYLTILADNGPYGEEFEILYRGNEWLDACKAAYPYNSRTYNKSTCEGYASCSILCVETEEVFCVDFGIANETFKLFDWYMIDFD